MHPSDEHAQDEAAEIHRLRMVIETERSASARWVVRLRNTLHQYAWLRDGDRGCYEYDDKRYLDEFRNAYNDLDSALDAAETETNMRSHSDVKGLTAKEVALAQAAAPSPDEREALAAEFERRREPRPNDNERDDGEVLYDFLGKQWDRDRAIFLEGASALARLRDVVRSEVDVVFTTATGEPALTYLRYVGDDPRPTDVRYKDTVLWMKVRPTQRPVSEKGQGT